MLKQASEDYFKLKFLSDRGDEARWAESVHLDFSRDGFDRRKWKKVSKNGWTLENTIVVHKSVQNTFFMTVGYGQGGYAGIQQQPSRKCGKKEGKIISKAFYGVNCQLFFNLMKNLSLFLIRILWKPYIFHVGCKR